MFSGSHTDRTIRTDCPEIDDVVDAAIGIGSLLLGSGVVSTLDDVFDSGISGNDGDFGGGGASGEW